MGKILYCSRTVPELEKTLVELKRLVQYRESVQGSKMKFTALGLSSRRNLCLHPEVGISVFSVKSGLSYLPMQVSKQRFGRLVDAECRKRTASWARNASRTNSDVETCSFYEVCFPLVASSHL